jgi:hypothetical protein
VFGRLKQDWGFRRFLLRGIDKVTTEWGILCIAHNIAKAAIIGPLLFLFFFPAFLRNFLFPKVEADFLASLLKTNLLL